MICHQTVKTSVHDRDMLESDNATYLVENFVPANAPLRIAVVTETWPPEVNGVALTLSRLIQELSQRQHTIQLIRPRQDRHWHGVGLFRTHYGRTYGRLCCQVHGAWGFICHVS